MSKSALSRILEKIWSPIFAAVRPIIHWTLFPIMFGVMLFVFLAPVFFIANLLGVDTRSVSDLAVVFSTLFGTAAIGSTFGGISNHLIAAGYRYRLLISFIVAGLMWGVVMAVWFRVFYPGTEPKFSAALAVSGLVVGIALGLGLTRAKKLDSQE